MEEASTDASFAMIIIAKLVQEVVMRYQPPKKVYLAGPEVFLAPEQNRSVVEKKKGILAELGMIGVDPLDTQIDFPETASPKEKGFLIYEANKRTMDDCDACIANLTPFRGPSADAGTVYEVGYMISQGKPVFGFTAVSGGYSERVNAIAERDAHDMEIERFGLSDNLMIECGIVNNGGLVAKGDKSFTPNMPGHFFWDESAFRECATSLQAKFDTKPAKILNLEGAHPL